MIPFSLIFNYINKLKVVTKREGNMSFTGNQFFSVIMSITESKWLRLLVLFVIWIFLMDKVTYMVKSGVERCEKINTDDHDGDDRDGDDHDGDDHDGDDHDGDGRDGDDEFCKEHASLGPTPRRRHPYKNSGGGSD